MTFALTSPARRLRILYEFVANTPEMRLAVALIPFMIFLGACSGPEQKIQNIPSSNGFAVLPPLLPHEAVATFGGGCFWGLQESMIQLKGVRMAINGYSGGTTDDPSYDVVAGQQTGHAEAVQVYYNPAIISYEQLLRVFFIAHDATQLNRQGPDVGSEYRSVVFYRTPHELKTLSRVMGDMEKKQRKGSFVTEMEDYQAFYPAESSHQNYYQKNLWDPYIRRISKPKVMHVLEAYPGLIKSDYAD